MIYSKRNLFCCLSTVILAACITSSPEKLSETTTKVKSEVTHKANWQSLLSNNSLAQWQQLGGKAPYALENKTIVGTTIATRENSFLATKAIFSDFIFEVHVSVDAGMNSGVQFRSNSLAEYKNGKVHGYQMEIDTSSRRWSGGIFDEGRSGWLYNLSRNTQCQEQFKVGEWNLYRIEAIGNSLRTFVNNVPCADLIDTQSAEGFIALQVHSAGMDKKGKQVKWRNPRIITDNPQRFTTPIPPNSLQISNLSNTLSDNEATNKWQLLWQPNIKPLVNSPANWQENNDHIAANATSVKTSTSFKVPYQNFEFEADIKIGDRLEGGIRYLSNTKQDVTTSLKFQLIDDELSPLAKDQKKSLGAIFNKVAPVNLSEPARKKKREKGKWGWNRIRVVINNGRIEHWMNNVKLAESTLTAEQKLPSSQLIIEIEKGAMKLRNIKLRELISNPGDRAGHVMKEIVPRDVIPPAPILDITQALASFKVHQDFEVQVVAQDPLLFDPVVALYDAAGRVWALEMTTYMPNITADGEMKHESQIVVLTDTNNDGEMDKRQVIVEKIVLPRALAFIEGGILWADNEKLYFSEVKNNQGTFSLISTEVVDETYAAGGNIEHKPNGLLYSLDNWYYNAKSYHRYRPYPLSQTLPKGAKEVYRNKLWKMAKAATEYRGQWGLTQDDYGRHYFNMNFTPIQTSSFLPNVATRNPKHKFGKSVTAQNVGTNDVYPVRVTPGINRGYMEGMYSKDYKLKMHTAACGPLIYRGNQYPEEYYGIGIAQEPAGNLVKATKFNEVDGVVSGENLFHQQEIMASTDERFRPVNAINAPDGTITVIDFYHGILQHRTFLTSYLAEQITMRDLERSKHVGRLYRLKHKNSELPDVAYLENLSAIELVPFLAHDNGWHRDMAQQLLIMQQDKSAVPALQKMAIESNNHLAQIKALWALEGLYSITFETLQAAEKNSHDKVKRSIYRLLELLPNTPKNIDRWLLAQAKNATKETAPSLSLAAGTYNAWPALSILINQFGANDFTYAALAHKERDYLNAEQANIHKEIVTNISVVMNTDLSAKNKSKLKGDSLISYGRGKALYNGEAGCFGCHGADGSGNPIIPPLNKSEWVTGSKDRLTAILLKGLTGPVTVNGKTFNSPMPMPGLGENHDISDQNLADIATYIRNSWNNKAKPVSANDVINVRKKTEQQVVPYTIEALKAQFK